MCYERGCEDKVSLVCCCSGEIPQNPGCWCSLLVVLLGLPDYVRCTTKKGGDQIFFAFFAIHPCHHLQEGFKKSSLHILKAFTTTKNDQIFELHDITWSPRCTTVYFLAMIISLHLDRIWRPFLRVEGSFCWSECWLSSISHGPSLNMSKTFYVGARASSSIVHFYMRNVECAQTSMKE